MSRKLAGLPAAAVARAEEVLAQSGSRASRRGALARLADDLPLFAAARREPAQARRALGGREPRSPRSTPTS